MKKVQGILTSIDGKQFCLEVKEGDKSVLIFPEIGKRKWRTQDEMFFYAVTGEPSNEVNYRKFVFERESEGKYFYKEVLYEKA